MKKLWCSIWRAFLNAFDDAVDHVAYGIDTLTPPILNLLSGVGEVAGGVISDVGGAISGVFGSSPLLWGGILIGAYLLLGGSSDNKGKSTSRARSLMNDDLDAYNTSGVRTV